MRAGTPPCSSSSRPRNVRVFADGDRFTLDAQDARAFAHCDSCCRRAAAADRGQRAVLAMSAFLQIAFVQSPDKVQDADIDQQAATGEGIPSRAARRFERRLFEVVAKAADLLEVGARLYFQVLFAHGNAWYLVYHCRRMLFGACGQNAAPPTVYLSNPIWHIGVRLRSFTASMAAAPALRAVHALTAHRFSSNRPRGRRTRGLRRT